jgi:hypothetical protein
MSYYLGRCQLPAKQCEWATVAVPTVRQKTLERARELKDER